MAKTYTIFAGVNGAGKSTLHNILNQDFGIRINLDEIIRDQYCNAWSDRKVQMLAARSAVRLIKECLNGDKSFNQETTLTGRTIISNMHKAKANGFKVVMYYMGLENVELSIRRVAKRVANGGHGIAEDDLRRRYSNSFENLKLALTLCDIVYICDNSKDNRRGTFVPVVIAKDKKIRLLDKNCPQYILDAIKNNSIGMII